MTEYDNTNTGSIFKNKKKESGKHPDYTGSINIDGVEYWQSVWLNTSKAGEKYFSQKFKLKEAKDVRPQATKPQAAPEPDYAFESDDIPF